MTERAHKLAVLGEIARALNGGRVVWASLLRLPAEQRSAIKMAILSEGSTAEAEGMGIGLRAVFVKSLYFRE